MAAIEVTRRWHAGWIKIGWWSIGGSRRCWRGHEIGLTSIRHRNATPGALM